MCQGSVGGVGSKMMYKNMTIDILVLRRLFSFRLFIIYHLSCPSRAARLDVHTILFLVARLYLNLSLFRNSRMYFASKN